MDLLDDIAVMVITPTDTHTMRTKTPMKMMMPRNATAATAPTTIPTMMKTKMKTTSKTAMINDVFDVMVMILMDTHMMKTRVMMVMHDCAVADMATTGRMKTRTRMIKHTTLMKMINDYNFALPMMIM